MSEFFSGWVIVLAALTFVLSLVLFQWGLRVRIPAEADGTTGHNWDGIREGLNKLPWWFIAYSAIGFIAGLAYLMLYPGLGNFKGLLGWTSQGQLQQDVATNNAKLSALIKPWGALTIEQLATKKEAVAIGQTLYVDNCAACHGSQALGIPALGAPNLTDAIWEFGGDSDSIMTSILDGRTRMMPPWVAALGKDGVDEVIAYVLSLSGWKGWSEKVAGGKKRFETLCVGCHAPEGVGVAMVGPNLADHSWLWGSDLEDVKTSIRDGRTGVMPAWRSRLTEDQARLIAAWVVAQAPR